MTSVLIKTGEFQTLTDRRMPSEDRLTRKDTYVKMEAQVEIMLPQAKEPLGLPEAGRVKKESSPRDFTGSKVLPRY